MRPASIGYAGVVSLVITTLLSAVASAAPVPVPVTTCGQILEKRGELVGDLDCSAFPGDAVKLENRARLTLNGFTLTGPTPGITPSAKPAIRCAGRCRVEGPGVITGLSSGVLANLVVVGSRTVRPWVRVDGVEFAVGLTAINAGGVAGTGRAIVKNCLISGGSGAIIGGYGARIVDSTVTGNSLFGARTDQRGVVLRRSTVTGNGFDANCGSVAVCGDVLSAKRPRVSRTSTCGTSLDLTALIPWGVCSGD